MASTIAPISSNGTSLISAMHDEPILVTPTSEESKVLEKELTTEDTSQPTAVLQDQASVVTPRMKRKAWIQFAALCTAIYVAGWNDGTTGPLLPRLQEVYHVCHSLSSNRLNSD